MLLGKVLDDGAGRRRGTGIGFESRGIHALKGVPGEWPLFVVAADLRQAQA